MGADPIIVELRSARKLKGLRQQEVADRAGISRRALVSIEAGKDCTLSTLRALAEALGVQIEAKTQVSATAADSPYVKSYPTAETMSAGQQQRELEEALRVQAMSPKERSQWISSTWDRLQEQALSIHRDLHVQNVRVRHFATIEDKNRYDDEQETERAVKLALSRGAG